MSFTGEDINGPSLRGTETSLILLSEEFAKKKFEVFFATRTNQEKKINGVHYINEKNIPHIPSINRLVFELISQFLAEATHL